MLDMGFEPQLTKIFTSYDLCENSKRQNLMFSATFENEIKGIARKFMNDYYYIEANKEKQSTENITQKVVFAPEEKKVLLLHDILQKINGSILSK